MPKLVRDCTAALLLLVASIAHSQAQSLTKGEKLFTEEANPPCGLCHTLSAAQSTGTIGPNLDQLKLDRDKIKRAVKNGVGNMPPYGDALSDAEIEAVSEYVAKASTAQK
jgi:cytochrome c6